MNSSELSGRILDCLECNDNRKKQETAIYNELSQIDSHVIRAVIGNLCEKLKK